jgi:hypothetical protein
VGGRFGLDERFQELFWVHGIDTGDKFIAG